MSYHNVSTDVNICLDEYVSIDFDIDLDEIASGVADQIDVDDQVKDALGEWESVVQIAKTIVSADERLSSRAKTIAELKQQLAASQAAEQTLRKEVEALEASAGSTKFETATSTNGSQS